MKLTVKLVTALMLVVTILAALNCFLRVKREVTRFEEESHERTRQFAEAFESLLVGLLQDASQLDTRQRIRTSLSKTTVRWVESRPDDPMYPDVSFNELQYVSVDHKHLSEMKDHDRNGSVEDYWMMEQQLGGLELSHSLSKLYAKKWDAILDEVLHTFMTLTVGGIAIAFIGITAIGRPLKQIIDKTKQIGSGDLSHPIEIKSRDELSDLGKALNDMCRRLAESEERLREESAVRVAAVEQLRHAERLKMVGNFASGVAHEIGTPLNVVSGRAALIESGKLKADESIASAKIIKSEAERITAMVRQLLDFARRKPSQKLPADLRTIFDRTIGLLEPLAKKRNITIEVEREDNPVTAMVDATQIQQVLNNLLANAAHSMPDGGKINVGFARDVTRPPEIDATDPQKYVCIRLQDEGKGIAAEDLPRIFEPFFTTKTAGSGTGLGLSISLGIAQDHGGWIGVDSQEGKGSCFSLCLPASSET